MDKDDILRIQQYKPKLEFTKQRYSTKHERLPDPLCRMALVASSGSGKTTVLISLLCKQMNQLYHKVYIAAPTFMSDDSWSVLYDAVDPTQVCTEFSEVDNFFNKIVESQDGNKEQIVLVIFDDWGAQTKQLRCLNYLAKCRHYGISCWLSVQKMSFLSTTCRTNLTDLCLWNAPSQYEREQVSKEYSWRLAPKEFVEMWNKVTAKKGDFLYIRLNESDPGKHYSKNFDTPISVD